MVRLGQVVPPALTTHLNDITHEVTQLPRERRQLRLLRNATTVSREPRAEDVGDMDKRLTLTDRTRFRDRFTQVFSSAEKLGVRIANVDTRKPPALVLCDEMAANQTKIHRSRPTLLDAANGVSSK